jgi:hypothetical protein
VSDARLFDHDKESGITEYFHYDDETGGFAIEYRQDVEQLIEQNKRLWNDTEKHTKYGELTRVASIPNVMLMELAKQQIVTPGGRVLDQERFRKWLNDRDHLLFRTRAGDV